MLIERFRSEQIACIKSRWTRFYVKMLEKKHTHKFMTFFRLQAKKKNKTEFNATHTQGMRMDIVRCGNEPENCLIFEYRIVHGESILKNGHP